MIEFIDVTKKFGKVTALENFSVKMETGKIIGLLAPNGSGKSTCLKIIAGLNKPDSGSILLFGQNPSTETKKLVAYLPEIDYLPKDMSIKEAKDFIAPFYEDFDTNKYNDLMKFLNLAEDMIIGSVSKGIRAKIKLLLTFSRNAKIILLDEPLSGIDILTRDVIIKTILKDYSYGEQTIIISTHEIDEMEQLIEDVIFIENGKLKFVENVEDLKIKYNMSLSNIMKEVYRNVL